MKVFYYLIFFVLAVTINIVHAAETGMPQLNTEFWPAQIFWLILIFSVLYIIIWKIFLPKIIYSIENRRLKIVEDLNEAQKLKEISENKLKEYDKIISETKKEAKKIIQDAKKKLDSDIENKKFKFNEEIEKEIVATEKEITALKKDSILNINKIASEISAQIIKKIIETEINMSSVSAIVEEVSKRKVKNYL